MKQHKDKVMASKASITGNEVTPSAVDLDRPFPSLRLYDAMDLWKGVIKADQVVAAPGSARHVELEGQEFLRFRSLSTASEVEAFAAEYGLLMLVRATERVQGSRDLPLWARVLAESPSSYANDWSREPVKDWIQQSGLLDVGVGLLGLVRAEQSGGRLRRSLIAAAQRLPQPPSGFVWSKAVQEQRNHMAPDAPWQIRSILDGAARAGLLCGGIVEQVQPIVPGGVPEQVQWLSFIGAPGTKSTLDIRIAPKHVGGRGVAIALARLLNPWVERVRASLVEPDQMVWPGQILPEDLLSIMWLQLVNCLITNVRPRVCKFPRCPGPPSRPGVFLWQWGRSPKGSKHRDAEYCHPRCREAHKQANRRERGRRELLAYPEEVRG